MPDDKALSDPFEMFRRLWGPLGLPVPGMAMPTLDPQEVDKRLADLRSVEAWLSMNLNMVRLSIQGLEVQKSALLAMRAATGAGTNTTEGQVSGASGSSGSIDANLLFWPWSVVQQAMAAKAAPTQGEGVKPEEGKKDGKQDAGT
jgi:hypothetical protein